VRAALSVAVLVAVNEWLSWPPLMESALAALLTCLCDAGGPIRKRVPALLSFAGVGALITAGFGLVQPAGFALIPFACLGIFCLSFMRVYGQAAMQVGNVLNVVLVLSLDHPWPDATTAATIAVAFAGGSFWALLLTMVIWRLHPYRPARVAVAGIFRAMAMLVGDLQLLLRAEPNEAAWERHARAHRRAVREAIEQARTVVMDVLRTHGARSLRAAQGLLRLETADQIFVALTALSDLLEHAREPAARQAAARFLRGLRPLLVMMSRRIVADDGAQMQRLARPVSTLGAAATALPDEPLRRVADAIVERLRVVLAVGRSVGSLPYAADDVPALPLVERVLAPLRANLDRNSAALRHALRAAVVAAFGLAITFAHPGPYQHWLTITMIVTLQPFYALTYARALERIGGTALGGVIASLIAHFCHTPVSIAAALFPLAVLALSLRAASFTGFITFITPLVVLLSELAYPGTSSLMVVVMRALYIFIGGMLAVGGTMLLWPSWEPDRLARELAGAIAAHGRYAASELSLLLGESGAAAVDQARRAAGMASNNLEASLSRALVEPRGRRSDRLEAAMVVDAALRRMAGRLAAMQLQKHERWPGDDAAWRRWRDWIGAAVAQLGVGPPGELIPRPALMPADAVQAESLARIARQIEVMTGALARSAA